MTARTIIAAVLFLNALIAGGQAGLNLRQREAAREAQTYYDAEDFHQALKLFTPIFRQDSANAYLAHRVGACLLQTRGDRTRAGRLLRAAVASERADALFHLGWYFQKEYKFREAVELFNEFAASKSEETDPVTLAIHMSQCVNGIKMMANPVDVNIRNIGAPVNTKDKEYVPICTGDGQTLYFTSRRSNSTAQLRDPNGEYYEDMYQSQADPVTGKWARPEGLPVPLNSELNDATVGLSTTGNTLLFFRTDEKLTGGDLYIARKKDGQFGRPEKFGTAVNSRFRETSACISADGQVMIFSSDRPGGLGGLDLYVSRRLPNGYWSKVINLGPVINTAGNEDAPYLSEDGRTLYFASDSHAGMGGFDLFKSTLSSGFNWSPPENMGYPINTPDDDIFLCMYSNGHKGFFSSDRHGGMGRQDIYAIEFVYRAEIECIARGTVADASGAGMGATITLLDEDNNRVVGTYRSNGTTGKFIMVVNPMVRYRMLIEAPGMAAATRHFNLENREARLSEHPLGTITLQAEP